MFTVCMIYTSASSQLVYCVLLHHSSGEWSLMVETMTTAPYWYGEHMLYKRQDFLIEPIEFLEIISEQPRCVT